VVNYNVLLVNLKDVTHNESLISPSSGNSMNWVLGHILVSRGTILSMLGEKSVLSDIQSMPYQRGVTPNKGDYLMPRDALVERLNVSQERIIGGLEDKTPEWLSSSESDKEIEWQQQPKRDQLLFLHFHEAYHTGQTGLLRRIIGKECAIP
jgi:uncharacterized damage-inducible protein DinB